MEEQLQRKSELTNLSIRDLFYKYIRFLPLVAISVALALFGAFLYLRYATLVYQSTGTLVIKDERNTGGDKIEQLMTSDSKTNIQMEIEYLQSRPLMERAVQAQNLNFSYFVQGKVKEVNIYKSCPFQVEAFQIFDSSKTLALSIQFENENTFRINNENAAFTFEQVFKNASGVFRLRKTSHVSIGPTYHVIWKPTAIAAQELLSDLVIAPKLSSVLILTKQATNPQLAADVINQLMEEYKVAVIEDRNDATQRTIAFIDTRVKVVEHELDSINQQILNFQQANNIIDPEVQSGSYMSRMEEANNRVSEQMIQLNNVEMIDDYLKDKKNINDPVPSTFGVTDATLGKMIDGYNQAQIEKKTLSENAPGGNATLLHKEQETEMLRQKILESLRTLKFAYRGTVGAIRAKGSTAEELAKLMPAKIQALADIKRAQQTKLAVYNSLLQKREESAIALASQISNTKVLQNATPNPNPVKPNKRNIRLLAILIGIAIPALFIVALELMNDKISSRHDIERITDTVIIGEIGHSYKKEALVVSNHSRSIVAEQFRIIRSNLQYVLNHIPKPVILVTSSFSGEGKSFVSTNLGAVLALTGKKTIVLEFDIRKPKVLSHLNLSKKPGLTNYLLGRIQLEELPIPIPGNENLFVLPCGPVPPNPAELLLDTKINELFAYLKSKFDVIIMDTAPAGMVSDAQTLSKFADATLYIVRQGHTYKKQISLIDEFYHAGKLPKVSIILNDIKTRSGYGYYGYGRYGYGQGYGSGSGYFEEDRKRRGIRKWLGWVDIKNWKKKEKTRSV